MVRLHTSEGRETANSRRLKYLVTDCLEKRFTFSFSYVALFTIIVLFALIMIFSDSFFLSLNFNSVLTGVALLGILALAESFVFLIGYIDLSITSIYLLSGVLTSLMASERKAGLFAVFLLSTTVGVALGTINGLFVVKYKIQPILASLGVLLISKGLANILITQLSDFQYPKTLMVFQKWNIINIPISFIIMIFIFACCYWLLKYTIIGRQIFAVGGNESSAKIGGLSVDKIKMLVYISAGFLASLAGIIFSYDTSLMSKNFGLGNEFDVILAVLIGGVSIYSGPSSVIRTLFGTIIVISLKYVLISNFISQYYQITLAGCLILIASVWQKYSRYR